MRRNWARRGCQCQKHNSFCRERAKDVTVPIVPNAAIAAVAGFAGITITVVAVMIALFLPFSYRSIYEYTRQRPKTMIVMAAGAASEERANRGAVAGMYDTSVWE